MGPRPCSDVRWRTAALRTYRTHDRCNVEGAASCALTSSEPEGRPSAGHDNARSAVFLDNAIQCSGIAGAEVNASVARRTPKHSGFVACMNGVAAPVEQRIWHGQVVFS